MKKKTVTAPRTYNPGKGRPKEHLAYLNYQEMQALKRLNGNNQERGPRGLPSFPPADSRSGSYNSGYGSGGSKPSGGSKGPGGGMMGGSGSGGSSRTSPSSGGGSSSRPSGGMMGGTGSGGSSRTSPSSGGGSRPSGGMRSDPGSTGGYKTPSGGSGSGSRPSGGMRSGPGGTGGYKTPGSGGSNADRAAINAANKTNTVSAQKAPAFKADTGRTVNVGPMGTPVNVKAPPGGKIKGAIQGVKAPQATQTATRGITVPAATVKINQPLSPSAARAAMGDVAPTPSIYKTVADADRAIAAEATKTYNQRFGTNYTSDQFSRLSKTVAGEAAGESDFARAAVANTFTNRAALAQQEESPYGYMGGGNFASLADQYDAYRMQNAPYRAAVPGTKTYQQGVNAMYQAMNPQSTFSKTASPKVLTATHYYNPAVVSREPDWARDKANFERVGSHLFGTAEASPKAVSKARAEQIARAGTTIVPTSSTFEELNTPTPRLRPESQNMKRPPSAGIESVKPTLREKEINDRLVNLQSPDGTRTTVSVGNVYDSLVGSGVPEEDAARIANEMIAAPGNEYNIKSPPPGRPNERTLDAGLERNPYDVQRAIGVPRARPPQPGLGRAAYDIGRSPTQYSGIDSFTPPQVTAGLSRNPFDTQTTGKYSGYGSFTPPVRTANLDRNVYDVGRTPSTYSGITGFNVPDSAADITRNQFDTRFSAPKYSGYGTTEYSTLSGIPTPDSAGLTGPAPSYGSVLGIAQSGFNALSDALKMPPETAKALRDWGLAKGIEPPRGIIEGAMSLVPDSVADAEFAKAATPFAQSLRDQVVGGVAGLQENYRNALAKAQKSSQQNVPSGATSEDESPSVDTSTTKISVGPNLGTIDNIVESQKNLTKQEKDELRRILSESAAGNFVEFSTSEFNSKIGEARRNLASGESPSSPEEPSEYLSPDEALPRDVSPEAKKKMKRDEVINKTGVNIIKSRNPLASIADAGSRLLTGKGIADSSADLKRAYMQASNEQRAALEREYPNLTKFASDVGETPQLKMENYTKWAERSGLRGTPSREGGRDNSGIASLGTRPTGDSTTTPRPDTPSTTPGRRPDIYYMWDLGVNIPSPSDPNYNQYQTYLAERLAAQRAMGYA